MNLKLKRWALSGLTCLIGLSGLSAVTPAQAELLKDPQWAAWLEAGKLQDLEQAAQTRLGNQPDDVQAVLALALVAMSDGAQGKRFEALMKPAQTCVERQPQQALCHYALGSLQGVQAMSGGMMKAISLSGSIKEQLQKAVELDPLQFESREALQQFYLLAPGVAGGSVSKARELAQAAQARQPEQAKLLLANVELHEERWADAERILASVKPGDDKTLVDGLRNGWFQLGLRHFNDKRYPQASTTFERLMRDYPSHAAGFYGMGRVLFATGRLDESVKMLERARTAEAADRFPVDHRLGFALLAKGDKAQGKAVLERFLANKRANPNNQEEVRKRLSELG